MCEFISWIEKGKKVYFLTGKQVFHTDKGQSLRTWCGSADDYTGHGPIRYFYGLEQDEGENRECTNFSSPDKFPDVIVRALKRGDFKGFSLPKGLLRKPLYDKYQADLKPLDDKYQADLKPLDDKYQADLKPLYDKHWADLKSLGDKYQADLKPLDDKHWADRKSLGDKHWALFTIPENRVETWR